MLVDQSQNAINNVKREALLNPCVHVHAGWLHRFSAEDAGRGPVAPIECERKVEKELLSYRQEELQMAVRLECYSLQFRRRLV